MRIGEVLAASAGKMPPLRAFQCSNDGDSAVFPSYPAGELTAPKPVGYRLCELLVAMPPGRAGGSRYTGMPSAR